MKFSRSLVVAASAVGTLLALLANAGAAPAITLGRAKHAERTAPLPAHRGAQNPSAASDVAAPQVPAPPGYPRYRLIDFGTLGGANSGPWGISIQINKHGEAIAQLETATPDPYPVCVGGDDCLIFRGAVREKNGAILDLGALPGTNGNVPVWINDNSLIAGLSQIGTIDPAFDFPVWRAVLWDKRRRIFDLGTLGGMNSAAYCVNSRGQVVGVASNTVAENPDFASFVAIDFPSETQARAFVWENGSMRDLGTLGGNDASATCVKEGGDIVGFSYTNTTPNPGTDVPTLHPFIWKHGTMRDLGSLGGTLAIPGAIGVGFGGTNVVNEAGEVAGTSTLPGDENWHAFFWSKGRMTDLGTLGGSKSDAVAINNKGQVVGRAVVTDTPFVRHAFIWEKGRDDRSRCRYAMPAQHRDRHQHRGSDRRQHRILHQQSRRSELL